MLEKVTYFLDIVSTVADAFLLLRVLTLRLQQTYTFITLYFAVTLLMDAGFWIGGVKGPAADRLFIYSRFVMAFVFPLAAWDVFEEVQDRAAKIRRIHVLRLFSGLTVALIFALFVSAMSSSEEETSGMAASLVMSAILLWAAATTASILFLWNVRRTLQLQQLVLSPNTRVFYYFFLLMLGIEMAQCLELLLASFLTNAASALEIAFGVLNIALVAWCTFKLRRVATDQPARQSEQLP